MQGLSAVLGKLTPQTEESAWVEITTLRILTSWIGRGWEQRLCLNSTFRRHSTSSLNQQPNDIHSDFANWVWMKPYDITYNT